MPHTSRSAVLWAPGRIHWGCELVLFLDGSVKVNFGRDTYL